MKNLVLKLIGFEVRNAPPRSNSRDAGLIVYLLYGDQGSAQRQPGFNNSPQVGRRNGTPRGAYGTRGLA